MLLYFRQLTGLIEYKVRGALDCRLARPRGKRETGANPVRSRHCDSGAYRQNVTGKTGKAMVCVDASARKPAS